MLGVSLERIQVRLGISVRVLVGSVHQVVCHIVCLPEFVSGDYTLIQNTPYRLVSVVLLIPGCTGNLGFAERRAYTEMHSPLPLAYAGKDAVHIFIFLLMILAGAFLDENLARLAEIAGFIFIRNRHGNNVEFPEVGLEVAGSAHVEHFEKPLLRNVQTILGTTLALCNPNGTLAGNNFGTNEFGQNLGRQIDFNHAVGPQQRLHHPVCEQVVPYADFGQRHIVEHQHPLRKRRIQDDVPVIGDGEEFPIYLMQISNSLVGKTGRGTPDDDIDGL